MHRWIKQLELLQQDTVKPITLLQVLEKIVFTKPVRLGEVVVTHARVTYVGKTSMLLKVTAHSENPKGERKEVVESAYMVFVAIEKNGKPKSVPEPVLETKEERELFEEGRMIKETMLKD